MDNPKMNQRIIPIEAFRFLIMLQICFWHFNHCLNTMQVGYIGVEFFFILTGIFLYRSILSNNTIGILFYSLAKVKKFYLAYVIALVIAYVISFPKILLPLFRDNPIHEICRVVGQLLLIQNIGLVQGGVNQPMWFFSILIYGGALVYGLIKYYTKICIRIIFPILILLYYSYVFNYQIGEGLEQWRVKGIIPMPFIRGVVDITLGVLVGYIAFNYQSFLLSKTKYLDILSFTAICGYVLIIFGSKIDAPYAIIFIIIILLASLNERTFLYRIFKSRKWLIMGGVTFDLFLIHQSVISGVFFVGKILSMSSSQELILYSVILIPIAFLFKKFVNYVQYIITHR